MSGKFLLGNIRDPFVEPFFDGMTVLPNDLKSARLYKQHDPDRQPQILMVNI